MDNRRLLTFIALPLLIGFERLAYYATRTVLATYMVTDLGIESRTATADYAQFTTLMMLTPILGGLLAIGIGPRLTLLAGALCSAFAYVMIPLVPAAAVLIPLVLLAIGQGLVRPSVFAIAGSELGGRHEPWRNALFALLYLAVNVGATLAPVSAGFTATTVGFAPVFYLSGGLMLLVAALAAGVAAVQRFGPPPDEAPRWRSVEIGILVLLIIASPYLSGLDAVSDAHFDALRGDAGANSTSTFLAGLNPLIVSGATFILAILFGVLALTRVRVPTLPLIGAGMILFALGVAPLLFRIGAGAWGAVVASITVTALGEALVGPLLLSRASADTNPRFATLVLALWIVVSSALSRLPALLSPRSSSMAYSQLIQCLLGCMIGGLVLIALRIPIARHLFPEEATPRRAGRELG